MLQQKHPNEKFMDSFNIPGFYFFKYMKTCTYVYVFGADKRGTHKYLISVIKQILWSKPIQLALSTVDNKIGSPNVKTDQQSSKNHTEE